MTKVKIILVTFFVVFFINNCGYTPQYAQNKNINFSIDLTSISGDRDFNNFLKSELSRYSEKSVESGKDFQISAISEYKKSTTLKDSSGSAKEYELEVKVKFFIKSEKIEKKLTLKEKFSMKKMSDNFEESKYERSIKNNFADIIREKLIFYLLQL